MLKKSIDKEGGIHNSNTWNCKRFRDGHYYPTTTDTRLKCPKGTVNYYVPDNSYRKACIKCPSGYTTDSEGGI